MTLGELLSVARDLRGWTLRDLESRCGVSNSLISQIETGHVRDPGFFTVLRIAGALGLSMGLVCAVEEAPPIAVAVNENKAKGGFARAEKLSPERRQMIAREAANKRWKNAPPQHQGDRPASPQDGRQRETNRLSGEEEPTNG